MAEILGKWEYLIVEQRRNMQTVSQQSSFLQNLGDNRWEHYWTREGATFDHYHFKRFVKTPAKARVKKDKV